MILVSEMYNIYLKLLKITIFCDYYL